MKFKHLLEPGKIGRMELKNRMILAPMVTNMGGQWSEVSSSNIEYYTRMARGGVGLVIVEGTYMFPDFGAEDGTGMSIQGGGLGIWRDYLISGLGRLAQTIKDNGARAAIQLAHGGRANPHVKTPVGASAVFEELTGSNPRELSIDEVERYEQAFADAALRAQIAGFDAVEFHGAHGYIIAGFLSGATNKRVDRYGGSLGNRMRFALNIVERTRAKVGRDFPIIWRVSALETIDGGLTLDEVKVFVKELERAGVDAIDLSAGGYGYTNFLYQIQPNSFPAGALVRYAEEMKREKVVDIPIITVGKINDPVLAEEILEKEKADFVAMGRGLLADPEFPRKVIEGRPEDIRKCICCGLCLEEIFRKRVIRCSVNPLVGRERQGLERTEKATTRKKVMVIGAGPAGMECARMCAMRGHEVLLYSKTKELGGEQIQLGTALVHKKEMKHIQDYYRVQLDKLRVKQELGVEVVPSLVQEITPDVVVIATGAEPKASTIRGADKKNVVNTWDVLGGKAKVGNTVVVVGGGLAGCDTADYLSEQGKNVTLTTRQAEVGYNMEITNKLALLVRFAERNLRIETKTRCMEITDEGIIAEDKWGREIRIKADTVVTAGGTKSVNALKKELVGKISEVYVIGDAKEPRRIWSAISEGFMLGRRV